MTSFSLKGQGFINNRNPGIEFFQKLVTKKFDPKLYLHRNRIYRPVVGAPRILRLWVWDSEVLQYQSPNQGKSYEARRYELDSSGKRIRKKQYFQTLEEARKWQMGDGPNTASYLSSIQGSERINESLEPKIQGPKLREVIEKWRAKKFPTLQDTTRISYEKILRLYLGDLADLSIYEITPEKVDEWLDQLKDPKGIAMQNSRRLSFRHELEVLSAVLQYYEDYHSDRNFYFPIKRRHWQDAKTDRVKAERPKDLSEVEFLKFREELEKTRFGSVLAALATVQYYQALRVSFQLRILNSI